jgi:hypothetical protein
MFGSLLRACSGVGRVGYIVCHASSAIGFLAPRVSVLV